MALVKKVLTDIGMESATIATASTRKDRQSEPRMLMIHMIYTSIKFGFS